MSVVRVRLGVPGRRRASRLAAWSARPAFSRARMVWRAALSLLWLMLGLLGFDLYVFGWVIPSQFTKVPVAPLYLPVAVILAVLLVTPPRRWWIFLLTAYAFQVALYGWFGYPLWFNLLGEAPTVIEPLVVAYLLLRLIPLPPRFANLREVAIYAGCVVLAAVLSAFMGGGIQALIGRPYWPAWRSWLLSDGLASLLLAPTIVLWVATSARDLRIASRRRAGEIALWCGAFLLLGPFAFRTIQDADLVPALVFVPVALLLWAAVRFGPRGIGTALSLVTVFAVVGVAQGAGPFVGRSLSADVLTVQLFLACIGVPLFLLAASVEERRHGQAELARSEGHYRAYFELNGVGAAEIDLDTGRFARVNDALCRITGYPRGELLRLRFGDITHPEDREENLRVFRAFRRQRPGAPASLTIEKRYVRRDGATIWVQIDATLVRDGGGRPLNVVTVVQDVTERRRAEAASAHLAAIVTSADDAIASKTLDGSVTSWNAGAERMFGYSAPEMIGQSILRLIPPDRHEEEERILARLRAGERIEHFETVRLTKDGRPLEVSLTISPIRDGAGAIIGASKIARDITDRKELERRLRASGARYRDLVETQTEMVCRYLPDSTLTFVNDAYCRYQGKPREQLLGTRFIEHLPPSARERMQVVIRSLLLHPGVVVSEHEALLPGRSRAWHQWVDRTVLVAEGRVVELQGIGRDITERKRAEEALRASEERYRAVVEIQTDLITRFRPDTTITFVNDANCHFFGMSREELLGTKVLDYIPPSSRGVLAAGIQALMERPGIATIEHETMAADGSRRWLQWVNRTILDAEGKVVELQGIGRDVTERRRAEKALEELTARLLTVQDEERRRLGRELHDGTAQTIGALNLALANLRTAFRGGIRDPGRFERTLADAQALVEQALRETRTLAYVLHPPQLDEGGLVPALEWYVKGFSLRSGIRVTLQADPNLGRLPDEVERALYRIVAECLANVQRHSGSACAHIALARRHHSVRLLVADRGGGIKAEAQSRCAEPDGVLMLGVGIPGMRQRVRQLDGWLKIRSSRRGTVVVAVVPAT